MAAEAVMGAALQVLIEKLIATAGEEISFMLGLEKEVASLKDSLEMVKAFLQDASRRRLEDEYVKLWLQKLEDLAYEADDILDDINYEDLRRKVEIRNQIKRKLCFYFSFNSPLVFSLKMAHRIKDLNLKLKAIDDRAKVLGILANNATSLPPLTVTDSLTRDPIVLGRENDVSKVISLLVGPSEEVLSVIPITGMGGMGKTTLARLILNDRQIVERFKQRIWVCVSNNFDDSTLLFKGILEQIADGVQEGSREAILRKLQEKLKEGNYLLVLDDLWNDQRNKWAEFRNSLLGICSNKGNFCIVTTRSDNVASIVKSQANSYALGRLSDDDCWLIIKEKAFPGKEVPEDIKEVGKDVASKCGGVPLAANIVGSTLEGKRIDEWTSFLQGGFSDLEERENMVLQVLKISFHRLSSPIVKKCFAYCSIFCKDEVLEKEQLIQLWMAEGFLVGNGMENDMENVGNRVYDLLLHNCFLQEAVRDKYGNIKKAKMHDLVHDLACSVSKVESFNVKNCKTETSYPPRLRYLAIESLDKKAYKLMQERAVYLRTLFLGGDKLSNGAFKDIKNLHVLNLQESNIKKLTKSIGKLINLRLLDVSSTRIKAFPKDICKLFNLQTLRAIGCYKLERLPHRLQQLVSLRHLVFKGHKDLKMPLRIRKLTSLRTLKFFNVGHENGRHIEELGSLKNLKGELEICHLERVNNKEEASRASLTEKPNIYKLKFVWSHSSESGPTGSGSNTCNNNDEEVLEGLRPHSNIKSLTINDFKGDHFPSWIMSSSVGATTNLDKLILIDCQRCEEVPTLGHLPLLKILELNGLTSVKSIGDSFYYPYGTSECSRQQTPTFRALRRFKLRGMTSLVKWIEAPPTTSVDESQAYHAFHSLEELEIDDCPNITIVPNHDFPALQTLKVIGVENGSWLTGMISGSNASSLTTLEIVRVAGVTRVSCNGQRLVDLEIRGCPDLQSIQFSSERGLTSSSSLKYFWVCNCEALTEVMLGDDLDYTSLERFWLYDCRNVSVSNLVDFGTMPRLRRLDLHGCPKLRRLPFNGGINCLRHLTKLSLGPLSEEDTSSLSRFCEMLQGIHELQSLRELELFGQPHWDSLPDQIQHLANLAKLDLKAFGSVEALPEWLGNLSSLEWLRIINFKSLRKLPSKEAMQRLTNLELLHIVNCPLLEEIENLESDAYRSEWPKISHIRHVEVS